MVEEIRTPAMRNPGAFPSYTWPERECRGRLWRIYVIRTILVRHLSATLASLRAR